MTFERSRRNCRLRSLSGRRKISRDRNVAPGGDDRSVRSVLGLDCRYGVASERQANRGFRRVWQVQYDLGQSVRIAGLALVHHGRHVPGGVGGRSIVTDYCPPHAKRRCVQEVGAEIAGLDCGDINAERSEFNAQRFRKRFDRGFCRRIDAEAGACDRRRSTRYSGCGPNAALASPAEWRV